jgi:hypothetical protein
VVAGAQHIVLKAWSHRTWLNNEQVTESLLQAGDRLLVGPIEYHVHEFHETAREIRHDVERSTPVAADPGLRELDRLRDELEHRLDALRGEINTHQQKMADALRHQHAAVEPCSPNS